MNQQPSILVTTDGSHDSRRILPHAAAFARARGDRLLLVGVVDPSKIDTRDGESESVALSRIQTEVSAELRGYLSSLGIEGETLVSATQESEDSSADVIVRLAESLGVDMVAMETRGHDAIRHAISGSVSLSVLSRVRLPIMLVGEALADDAPPRQDGPYRLIVTSDGSLASLDIVEALSPLLTPGRFAVTLLRIHERLPAGEDDAAAIRDAEEQLRALLPMFQDGLQIEVKVREIARMGGIDTAIIEEAQAIGASAIAMSTHGVSAGRHLFGGSVSLTLLSRSPLPVIMARGE